MKISIVIPVYHTEQYLKTAINSILAQSIHQVELVIVNDGSGGECDSIVNSYKNKIVINYIRLSKNYGRLIARIEGMRAAIGDYIGFVDADDYIQKNMLEIMYNTAINTNADIVHCRSFRVKKFCRKLWKEGAPKYTCLFEEHIYEKFLNKELIWSLCDKLFRKEIIKKSINELPMVYQQLNEDMLICSVLFYNAKSYYSIGNILYNYRVHGSSITHSYNYEQIYDLLRTLSFIREFTGIISEIKFRNTPLYDSLLVDILSMLHDIPLDEKDDFFASLITQLGQNDFFDLIYGVEKQQTSYFNSPFVKVKKRIKKIIE